MPFHIYIIHSRLDKSYHIGSAQELDKRLQRHNQGRSKYIKNKRPWELLYYEDFPDRSNAMKRELEIKRKKKRGFIESLVRMSRI